MIMGGDECFVEFRIWCDTKENSVHMDVKGFNSTEDALAFADWLSELPLDDGELHVLH
jgi:hypothetical protein